ncbi:hypothetical protein PHYSODRAFT_263397 [Phytophthora sojae]|uniref:Phosphoribosyltransferase domain-containing protein n=1 Tax=Phytophthora sojae (strain P6497) TaxID=1094619 RepID=G4YY77_PHYSP|nr:hypothetical protein PHYSODRAFT_263397 [Phytophthora sojae]EGZ23228.1 hypothetical protein PHYSODRAFT_263397 [Phytophthora sojae]|eukprot:XP_009518516.1 hypothetical protein PHYSODRAFT_263397 [Phytophthora sojae]
MEMDTPVPNASVETPHVERISRYLREVDRRAILLRIEGGEKQAVLAKEYQVSRAAICNLNKHRDEVLARKDGNPLAKHPRKPRPKATIAGMPSSMKWSSSKNRYIHVLGSTSGSSLERDRTGMFELKSRAAALLLTTLRNKFTTSVELLRASERLVRLLMEEALALPPIRKIGILLDDQHRESGLQSEHPPCAVSIEKDEGHPMLELFRTMGPEQPTGLVGSQLPTSLVYHNVFLLSDVSTSGRRLCAAIRCLLERGASPVMMFIVSLMTTNEAVELVHLQFSDVTFVTAHIVADEEGDRDDARPAS